MVSEFERRRARQVAVMADADRLRLLALILTDPRGAVSVDQLTGAGMDREDVRNHLEVMTRAELLIRTGRTPAGVYRPTHDALSRFGADARGLADRTSLGDHSRLLARISSQLTETYSNVFAPETVERYVEESYDLLARRASVGRHLPALTARFAADRLSALALAEGLRVKKVPDVLFVCVRNAGRSQIAAAVLRSLAGEAVTVRTAGSMPATYVDPGVIAELRRRGIDGLTEFPRPLTDEVVRASDIVVTMGCGDACPVLPGRRYLDWPVADPAGLEAPAIAEIIDDISRRVRGLLQEMAPRSPQSEEL